jgi:hypothetical protein
MDSPNVGRLRFEDHRTTISHSAGPEVVIAVGVRDIADKLFQHDPPTPLEMEQAIDVVEDALAATDLRQAVRGDLLISDPQLHALLGLQPEGDRVTREETEARFQRLASASLGHAGLLDGLPSGRSAAAALLILRECMHHLGYEGVQRASTSSAVVATSLGPNWMFEGVCEKRGAGAVCATPSIVVKPCRATMWG